MSARMVDVRIDGDIQPPRPPWIDPRGCWAHCDPEGWHAPCTKPTDGESDA